MRCKRCLGAISQSRRGPFVDRGQYRASGSDAGGLAAGLWSVYPFGRGGIQHTSGSSQAFAAGRDPGGFHNAKNLAMALTAEAGELLKVFQWLTTDEVRAEVLPEDKRRASEELVHILVYAVRLADVLGIPGGSG